MYTYILGEYLFSYVHLNNNSDVSVLDGIIFRKIQVNIQQGIG